MTNQKQSGKDQLVSFSVMVAKQEKRKEQQQDGKSHIAAARYHGASDADDDDNEEHDDDDDSKRAVASSKMNKISGTENGRVETDKHVQNKTTTTTTTTDAGELVWFVREEERWELTWPIWHMLPRAERKALAVQHGFETIGDFEEYMTLQRAVGDSSEQNAYENALAYGSTSCSTAVSNSAPLTNTESSHGPAHKEMHPQLDKKLPGYEDDDDDASDTNEQMDEKIESELRAASDKLSTSELVKVGGRILLLPDEMLHRIFDWLPVDTYATLALVSPHWKSFTRTEAVYKRLCERLYLNQSKRRALHVSRFGNSYHTMLQQRPRVRAGGGVYVLKYSRVKHIQRDMWTEVRTYLPT